jgi:outer membrane protein OmpA-like peptidoglycan-associated protein
MAEDWLVDVRKYAANADENVVQAIVRYCGIALQSRDSQLVAMSDKKERELVRENFLKKKLGLTDADSVLDDAVLAVGEQMKADRTKNRVTVYYLLAQQFGLLNVFGGVAGAAGAAAAVAGALGGKDDDTDTGGSAAPLAAAGLAGAAAAGVSGSETPAPAPYPASAPAYAASAPEPAPEPVYAQSSGDDGAESGGGIWGWLKWLLLALLLLALLFWLLRGCSNQEAAPVVDDQTTEATAGETADADAAKVDDAKATETAAPAVPEGSGVVAAERDGKPMLTVYFDSGKSAVSNDLATASAKVKEYIATNASAKLAVSGFNDPTGNAEINARLSKERAQGVAKALEAAGIPTAAIELVKPADATDASVDKSQARRVEVTVK